MKITKKLLAEQEKHVNEFALANSIYKLHVRRLYNWYHVELAYKTEETGKILRVLHTGSARDVYAFMLAFECRHWYMTEPF